MQQENIKVPFNYNFERADIFLRVIGRLPNKEYDHITQNILDEFIRKYKSKDLIEGIVPLYKMYALIKNNDIKSDISDNPMQEWKNNNYAVLLYEESENDVDTYTVINFNTGEQEKVDLFTLSKIFK